MNLLTYPFCGKIGKKKAKVINLNRSFGGNFLLSGKLIIIYHQNIFEKIDIKKFQNRIVNVKCNTTFFTGEKVVCQ